MGMAIESELAKSLGPLLLSDLQALGSNLARRANERGRLGPTCSVERRQLLFSPKTGVRNQDILGCHVSKTALKTGLDAAPTQG